MRAMSAARSVFPANSSSAAASATASTTAPLSAPLAAEHSTSAVAPTPHAWPVAHSVVLSPFNTLALPSCAARYLKITDPAQLTAPDIAGARGFVLGGGSNLVLTGDIDGLVLHMAIAGKAKTGEDAEAVYVTAGAGERWHDFVQWTLAQGWPGLENLSLIPGTVGAAPVQNIGAYGVELQHILESVQVYDRDERRLRDIPAADCRFAYRDSRFKHDWRARYIISAITLRLSKRGALHTAYPGLREQADKLHNPADVHATVSTLRRSKLPDPAEQPNAGSFFHNPVVSAAHYAALCEQHPAMPSFAAGADAVKIPAAWLIEQCGFKGARDGKVGISTQHALVLVNDGGTATEILAFAGEIQRAVQSRFGLALNIEPTLLE